VKRDAVRGPVRFQNPVQAPRDELPLPVRVSGDPEGAVGSGSLENIPHCLLTAICPYPGRSRQFTRTIGPIRLPGIRAMGLAIARQRLNMSACCKDSPTIPQIALKGARLRAGLDDENIHDVNSTSTWMGDLRTQSVERTLCQRPLKSLSEGGSYLRHSAQLHNPLRDEIQPPQYLCRGSSRKVPAQIYGPINPRPVMGTKMDRRRREGGAHK